MSGKSLLALPFAVLASANFFLMVFNLLPAYPLDGGHTLDAWLGAILGSSWATRIVGTLGLLVAAGVAYLALPSAFFLMLVALFLAMANWEALQNAGRWRS
jgi:Zn-dependent protease